MKHSKQQDIPFLWALFPLLVMIVTMAVTIIRFEGTPHIPLIVGTITVAKDVPATTLLHLEKEFANPR